MANQETTLTASNIKYLLAMYKLDSNNKGTQCVRLAEKLEVTKPSVHKMINTLKAMRLVKKNPYGEVFFTDEGLQLATKYSQYYNFVSDLLKVYISDESDIHSASCAVLAGISDEGLVQLCEKQQIDGGKQMYKTILKIDGMACGMCEAHINDCIRQNFSINKIKTSHSKGESEIISDSAPDENKLKEVIGKTGYTLVSFCTEPYVKKGLFGR